MERRLSAVVLTVMLVAAPSFARDSNTNSTSYFWSPLEFGGGVELQYQWKVAEPGREQDLELILRFEEKYDGAYDVTATLRDGVTHYPPVTERRVSSLFSWAMEKVETGQVEPTRHNLSMVAAANLVVPALMYFSGISTDQDAWTQGFSMKHPNQPEMRFTATTTACSAAGISGQIMSVESPQGVISACLSSHSGLPLVLRSSAASGEFSEFVLESYESRKLIVPALFHKGEPEGFKDIKWGTHHEDALGLVPYYSSDDAEGVTMYRRTGTVYGRSHSPRRFLGVQFKRIEYYFVDDKFSSAVGKVASGENWHRLNEALILEYGQPFQESDFYLDGTEVLSWPGAEHTSIYTELAYGDDEGTMTISSVSKLREIFDDLFDDLTLVPPSD